ncbi:MAG TPA: DMT family transporter [Solirubrobacterales bacterium]|nr:DMT family transporter [Solirubrobacterales bacterium]
MSLVSGLSWGISDFLGGTQSRKMPVLAVLFVTQPAGLAIALLALPLFGADPLPANKLALAFAGGAAVMGALGAFYSAMAMGTMSVVAPIAALGVVVPVGVGLARGEAPSAIQLVGLVIAILGVVVLSYEDEPRHAGIGRKAIALALVSALGFGTFFTLLDLAASDRPGWAIVAARAGGVVMVAIAVSVARPSLAGVPAAVPILIAIAAFDITANSLFTVASTMGLLPLVAVGGSMYPAFTIALAHLFLGERLRRPQRFGVVLALAGVFLIAGGAA